jgi:hypothetical protein
MPKQRVEIPKKAKELLDLALKIFNKHSKDGPTSKLNILNWDVVGPTIATAIEKHNLAEDLNRQRDKAYEERDILLKNIEASIKSSRDVLTGVYSSEMKNLGEWGFNVYSSAAPTKTKDDKGTV